MTNNAWQVRNSGLAAGSYRLKYCCKWSQKWLGSVSLSQALTFDMSDLSFGLVWPELCASIDHVILQAVEAIGCEWGIILDQEQINSFTAGNTFSCFSLSPIFLSNCAHISSYSPPVISTFLVSIPTLSD